MLRTATRRAMLYPAAATAAAGEWWDVGGSCIGAWQAVGAASYAASLTDISGNGNDASTGTEPSWDATYGWYGDTTAYVIAGTSMGPNQTVVIRYSNFSGTFQYLLTSASLQHYMRFAGAGVMWFVVQSNRIGTDPVPPAAAVFAMTMSATACAAYIDGSPAASDTDSRTVSTGSWYILAHSNPAAGGTTARVQAVAHYSTVLSGADIATLSTAMAAL